jgi:hypothetical protein
MQQKEGNDNAKQRHRRAYYDHPFPETFQIHGSALCMKKNARQTAL